MLTDDAALTDVAHGDGGLLASLPDGTIHMAMGTHGIDMTRSLASAHAEAGQPFVAAPVLGRPDRAAAGPIIILPGGPADMIERVRPLFEILGARTFESGTEPEAAAAMKITHNFILGCAIEVMGEGVSLVRKFGVDPAVLYQVLSEGLFACPAYKIYGGIIVEQSYDKVGVTARIGLKDVNLALSAAESVDMPLPSANVWRDRLLGAIAHGDGELDWAGVARDQARASGLE